MAAWHLLFLRRVLSQQRGAALRERDDGPFLSKPLCQAPGSGTVFFDRERPLGVLQSRGGVRPHLSRRRLQLTLHDSCGGPGIGVSSDGPADGAPLWTVPWRPFLRGVPCRVSVKAPAKQVKDREGRPAKP